MSWFLLLWYWLEEIYRGGRKETLSRQLDPRDALLSFMVGRQLVGREKTTDACHRPSQSAVSSRAILVELAVVADFRVKLAMDCRLE